MNWTSTPARRPSGLRRRSPGPSRRLQSLAAAGRLRRPIPLGAGLVDLGQTDPKLTGFQAPGGFKLELVADESALRPRWR